MKRTLRGLRIFAALAPFLVGFLRDRRRFLIIGRPASRRPGHHAGRAERLVAAVADLGPTFIKLAQVLSARADLIREPYFSAIGTLQDQVPPISGDGALEVVEAALGRPAGEVFDSFEPRPIAAASLGQVHRATLRGREVAVKVLRPDVESVVAIDLDLSFRLLFWLNILFPNHQVRGITNVVREFSVRVREEMDFRSEAANIERFHRLMADVEGVRAPEVIGELTRKEVLVMEHLEGTKVDRLDERFASGELEFEPVMRRLTGLYLRMMMLDGFLHADPHPGNLLVGPDGTIIVLDWGMVLDVPKQTRDTILSVALSVGREDLDGVISGMYGLGMISPEVSRGEIREAAIEIMKVIERVRTSPVDRVREVVQEIWDTFQTWPLLLPQELVYFFRTAVLLEAIGFRYDPEFNGLHLIRRVVAEHRGELLRKTGARARGARPRFHGGGRARAPLGERPPPARGAGGAPRPAPPARPAGAGAVHAPPGPALPPLGLRHGDRGHLLGGLRGDRKPASARPRPRRRARHVRPRPLHSHPPPREPAPARTRDPPSLTRPARRRKLRGSRAMPRPDDVPGPLGGSMPRADIRGAETRGRPAPPPLPDIRREPGPRAGSGHRPAPRASAGPRRAPARPPR